MQTFTARSALMAQHDQTYFTQGLEIHEATLLESTGLYGQSRLVYRRLDNLSVFEEVPFDDDFFAEDIVAVDGRLQITSWREHRALAWAIDRKEVIGHHKYDLEGWGICHDGKHYWTSNGTSQLRQRDHTMAQTGLMIDVKHKQRTIAGLNCLAWSPSETIFANVYGSDTILEINPKNGDVIALIDARSLRVHESTTSDVMNGLVWDSSRSMWLVTGKWWAHMHLIKLEPTGFLPGELEALISTLPAHIDDIDDISQPEDH